jgi:glycerate kinase
MSLPFMQPYMGLGNSLQTAQGGAAGGTVGGWVELGRTTLGSALDTIIEFASLADKRYYMFY